MRYFLPAALFLSLTLAGIAGACPVVVRSRVVVTTPVVTRAVVTKAVVVEKVAVVAPVAVAAFVPVAVAVPAYSAGYVPSVAPSSQPAQPAQPQADAILEAIKVIGRRLDNLEAIARGEPNAGPAAKPNVQPGAPPTMPPANGAAPKIDLSAAHAVFAAKCAACHTTGRLNKDTTFVLLAPDGKTVAPLNDRQRLNILRRINRQPGSPGAMPPKKEDALSDTEAAAVGEYVDTQATP